MKGHYRINEIAALYGLHPDTLRYYEAQGLLQPRRGANNYRLYSIQEICDLNIIQNLRSLDVPVSRIRDYLTARTVTSTLELLDEETALIETRIAALRRLRAGARRRREKLLGAGQLPVGCRLLELPERRCYRLSEGVTMEKDVDFLLKKLEKKRERQLRSIGERQMGAALDEDWFGRGVYNRYAHAFYICEGIEDHDDVLPPGRYASTLYRGDYANIARALPELLQFVCEQGLAPQRAPMELYHIDIHDSSLPAEFLTEIQVLVAQA